MATRLRFNTLAQRARIGRFLSVGAVGTVIETALVAILTTAVGTGPLLAKAVGAECSISTIFLMNDRWTFAGEGEVGFMATVQRWGKSHIVRTAGLLLSFPTLYLLTSNTQFSLLVAGLNIWPTVANTIAISISVVVNYIAECLFTWEVTETANQ